MTKKTAQQTATPTDIPLDEGDITWIKSYAADVEREFRAGFAGASDRFSDAEKLLGRFAQAIAAVLKHGRSRFRAVDEAHNELCVAAAVLANSKPRFVRLDYEPPLPGSTQSIDFKATADDGWIIYVDVKTIKPQAKDRWEQFEEARRECRFAPNVEVMIMKESLGGEIWHSMFAARGRMMEYTLELEGKIAAANLRAEKTAVILMLCGEGFHWREDDLEDFVTFYYSGAHRADDPFANMEDHEVRERGITFQRSIARFACMSRPQGEISYRRLNWNVQPPRVPQF
jgi:hypothetical protein